jgi:hypothetical protein
MKISALVILIVIILVLPGYSHHGKDYIEVESYHTPERGTILIFLVSDYHIPESGQEDLNRWEFQPGVFYGLTDHIGAEVHSHIEKGSSEDFNYEATALEIRGRLLGENSLFLDPAASIEYELSATDEPDQLAFRVILGKEVGFINFTFNFLGSRELESEGEFRTGYALGANRPFWAFEKVNLELFGDLSKGNGHYVLPSLYLPVTEHFSLKAGGALGLSEESESFSLRTALHLLF